MLLHRLTTNETETTRNHPTRPFYAVQVIPCLPVWSWILALSCVDAAGATASSAVVLFSSFRSVSLFATQFAGAVSMSLVLWTFVANSQGLYQPLDGPQKAFRFAPVVTACLIWLSFEVLLLETVLPHVSLDSILVLTGLEMSIVLTSHWLWHRHLLSELQKGGCLERTLFLGSTAEAARAASILVETETGGRIRAVACVPMPGTPFAPSIAWIEDAVSQRIIDRVLITGFEHFSTALQTILPALAALDIDITLLANGDTKRRGAACVTRIGSLQAILLATRPLTPLQTVLKRLTDITVAVTALALLSPLSLAIAVAIKIDSGGPVFFYQGRVGFQGNVFQLLKFRTMFPQVADNSTLRQTTRGDTRVTRVGRTLRRMSLDEIPQLFNVLSGDMSIVGPRPHALGMMVNGRHLHDVSSTYMTRHRVKPGITGWAQINDCRGEITCEKKLSTRVILDCEYIEHWSFGMDIWIMMRTIALLAFDRHAY